ncbi:MAG: ATP-binding protein [Armatimonadota bacterium]
MESNKSFLDSKIILDALVNSVNDMIWAVDAQSFGLIFFNRGLEKYFETYRGINIAIGMTPDDLLPTIGSAQLWYSIYHKALIEGPYIMEYPVVTGTHTLLLSLDILKRDGHVFGVSVFGKDITEMKQAEEEKKRFYKDTIKSITQGKLNLVSYNEIQQYLDSTNFIIDITSSADTSNARHIIRKLFESNKYDNSKWDIFELAMGEAMTNAVKHACQGRVYAGVESDVIWVAVSDNGPGIPSLTLPNATLQTGYSTKVSMGMGYSLILKGSNRVLLHTDSQGTIVVLLIDTTSHLKNPSLDDFADAW